MTAAGSARVRTLRAPVAYDLTGSLRPLVVGRWDPCARFVDDTFWLAANTPDGPGTLAVSRSDAAAGRAPSEVGGDLVARGYGSGAGWLVERADAIVGLRDDLTGFAGLAAGHPVVAWLARTHQGLRLPATGQVFRHLLRAVLEQKVTTTEAHRAYGAIVRRFGTPAPGPQRSLWVPPEPAVLAAQPYWVFHPFGVEQRRAETLLRAAAVADRLERCADPVEATSRLTAVAGIGRWTAAEVVRPAFGDPDAVSVGDFHLPNTVAWALAGEARGDDARMLALLEPFRGHRGRVCALLELAGARAPRFGPRMPLRSFARF